MTGRLLLFDFDSTLVSVESLDLAAARALEGASDRDARLAQIETATEAAMEGRLSFAESIRARLAAFALTRNVIEQIAHDLVGMVTPGMAELIGCRREAGDQIAIVSGGFHELITPSAETFEIEPRAVFANKFEFEGDRVSGLDETHLLAHDGGKVRAARRLKAKARGEMQLVMIGDGATDLEVWREGVADHFIGFGFHATREPVRAAAPNFAMSVDELAKTLDGL